MVIITNWNQNQNDELELAQIVNQETGEVLTMNDLLTSEEREIYVDKLDIFSFYFLHFLFDHKFKSVAEMNQIKEKSVYASINSGNCNSMIFKYQNTKKTLYNFEKKFGVEFGEFEENQKLIDYAHEHNRNATSIGADAYNEFIHTIFRPKKNPNANKKLMRVDFPILNNKLLEKAKKYVCGFQFYTKGNFENVIDYDQSSAYPSQLLCSTPTGAPVSDIKDFNKIPRNYWFVAKVFYMNIELKTGFDWLDLKKCKNSGYLYLTKELYELFLTCYECLSKVVEFVAFKTICHRFDKFIDQTIIKGKINKSDKAISKYNKNVGNALIGYLGRNTAVESISFSKDGENWLYKRKELKRDPLYLPVYLFAIGKQKSEFIKTINQFKDSIIYANTDGFISTKRLNIDFMNYRFSSELGKFREKHQYQKLYIKTINGYAGLTSAGELDNTIAGMTLERLITPQEYESGEYSSVIQSVTKNLTIKRQRIWYY